MCSGFEAGSYLRLIDSCIPHLKAQGTSATCNESKEEEKKHPYDLTPGTRSEHRVDPTDIITDFGSQSANLIVVCCGGIQVCFEMLESGW